MATESQPQTPKPLTAKQQAFVAEYLKDLHAAAAYERVYKARGAAARSGAARLLANVSVAAAVRKAMAARSERTRVEADYVVRNLVENVERALQHKAVLDREGNPTGEYVWAGGVANRALELLGKHLGMFVDKVAPTDPSGTKEYAGGFTDAERMAGLRALVGQFRRGAAAGGSAAGGGEPPSVEPLPGPAGPGLPE